jgi:serine/threonine-protein kinase HipA
VHQEDLCQALGLTPDFKYQKEGWQLPSYRALAELLDEHGPWPGLDRLAGAQATVFHYLIGNADAHAKNISLIHARDGVRLAPLYDVVSTAAYPDLSTELALSIGDELNPDAITQIHWSDLANDFNLNIGGFERVRRELLNRVAVEAPRLRDEARAKDWYDSTIDSVLEVIVARGARVV